MQPLMDFGIDFLSAIELRNLLEQKFAIALPATVAFDYPTASTMATFISSLLYRVPLQNETHANAKASYQAVSVLQEQILEIVQSVLGTNVSVDQVTACPHPMGIHAHSLAYPYCLSLPLFAQPLMEAGLGSFEAIELQNTIAEVFELEVLPTLAFDYPSVKSIAHYLANLKWSNEGSDGVNSRTTLERASMRPIGNSLSCIMGVGCRYPGGALNPILLLWNMITSCLLSLGSGLYVILLVVEIPYTSCKVGASVLQLTSELVTFFDALGKARTSHMEVLWSVMQHHNDIQELVPTSRWDIDSVYTPFIAPERLSVTSRYGSHVHKHLQDVR